MSDPNQRETTQANLLFFGTISASFSHEINNVISIIGEISGLMSDFFEMAQQGREIDIAKLAQKNSDILRNTKRGELLIKNFNRFAHSSDEPLRQTVLEDLLENLVALANRLASRKSIDLKLERDADNPISVTTNPFLVMNIVFIVLERFFKNASDGGEINIFVTSSDSGAIINIRSSIPYAGSDGPDETSITDDILDQLKADLTDTKDSSGEQIVSLVLHD